MSIPGDEDLVRCATELLRQVYLLMPSARQIRAMDRGSQVLLTLKIMEQLEYYVGLRHSGLVQPGIDPYNPPMPYQKPTDPDDDIPF